MYSASKLPSHLPRCAWSLLQRAHTPHTQAHAHTVLRTQHRLLSDTHTSSSPAAPSVNDTQEHLHPRHNNANSSREESRTRKFEARNEKRSHPPVGASSDPRLLTHQLRYLVSTGKRQDALRLFDQMRQRNCANVYHFSVMLRVCSDARAWELFQEMCYRGLTPNDFIYSSLLQSCYYTKNVELAKTIMEDMRLRGISATSPVYNALIKVLTAAREYDSVKEVAKSARKNGMFDMVTYNSVIVACAQQDDIESIKGLLGDMHREGLKPDLVTYDVALRAFKKAGEEQTVTALLAALQVS